MAPKPCELCKNERAVIRRPKNGQDICKPCFYNVFETEIHHTIITNKLFSRGERVAIGASGGKDSTVLASVLKTLNERYDYGVEFILLSIDEGIKGYRDDSLETVKNNARQYDMPLMILGYAELYGWTMDQVVEQVGKKGNCTYCGVFRRQALDRGAAKLGVRHVVTGHNADDIAETVLMNLLRGDLPRLARTTSIVTSTPSGVAAASADTGAPSHTDIKRSKPLKYAYEKEIVMYAHHKQLEYFCTECIYSPEAFRGSARALIKNLEKIRPSAILDVVRSGEDMAKLVPAEFGGTSCRGNCSSTAQQVHPLAMDEEGEGGCGSAAGRSSGGEMAAMEVELASNDMAESEGLETDMSSLSVKAPSKTDAVHIKTKKTPNRAFNPNQIKRPAPASKKYQKQVMGQCSVCGYLTSQDVCKACTMLKDLNKNRPRNEITIQGDV